MQIDVRNLKRERLFRVKVDAKAPPAVVRDPARQGVEIYLNWDRAIDDKGYLRRCPVCGCRETFVRNDFPQVTGFAIVAAAAVASVGLFAAGMTFAALAVLAGVALIDAMIYLFTGRCLVCHRCRSEFRNLPIARDHPRWDLAIGEKYRLLAPGSNTPGSTAPGRTAPETTPPENAAPASQAAGSNPAGNPESPENPTLAAAAENTRDTAQEPQGDRPDESQR